MSTLKDKYGVKVFLGGTYSSAQWRAEIIPNLEVPYYNPVGDGSEADQAQNKRLLCSHSLYVITPEMEGAYSIAELVEDSIKRRDKVIVCMLKEYNGKAFSDTAWASCKSIMELVNKYHSNVVTDLAEAVRLVNAINL